jgi:hypothetical protein
MKIGRPRIISSPEEMLNLGNAYFEKCESTGSPILVTGLALALGLSSRESLLEYGRRPEYSGTVKRLKTVCENYAENHLYGNCPTGAIFALKNYGWTDKTQQEITGKDGGPIETKLTCELTDEQLAAIASGKK